MRYILGVDGGGSKTYAVVVDENGNKLGSGVAGCGNHQVRGVECAITHISNAVKSALTESSLQPGDVTFVQYGLAGADREKDFQILRPALAALPFQNWDVVCDTMEGLRSGSMDNTGVVLVCGSGTNAMGRNREGNMVQTGGFEYLYGDAAGGHFLAREAFRAAVRSWELREAPTVLTELIPKRFGMHDMAEVYNDFLDRDVTSVPADLTVLLHEAARLSDQVARNILRRTGRELGLAANSVIRRLGGFGGEEIPVVTVGSVIQKGRSEDLLDSLLETVHSKNPEAKLVIPEMAPVYGAVLLGMDHLGIPVLDAMYEKFVQYGGYAD